MMSRFLQLVQSEPDIAKVPIMVDSSKWEIIAEGSFGNILNDPSRRSEYFKQPATCRYIRFVSLSAAQGTPYAGAADIQALTP